LGWIIDPISFEYLDKSELDYKKDLSGARFIINNPIAVGQCGCGRSINLDLNASKRATPSEVLQSLIQEKYSKANVIFWAGSIARGAGSDSSDLDCVVFFEKIDHAYREAIIYQGWPIDIFVHDKDTFRYFVESIDLPSYMPALPVMVAEGVQVFGDIKEGDLIKNMASTYLKQLPVLSSIQIDMRRFTLTDLVDDLKECPDEFERLAIIQEIYKQSAELYLLFNNQWIGKGKQLMRFLSEKDPVIAREFYYAFYSQQTDRIVDHVTKILNLCGGPLWNGFFLEAPASWKKES